MAVVTNNDSCDITTKRFPFDPGKPDLRPCVLRLESDHIALVVFRREFSFRFCQLTARMTKIVTRTLTVPLPPPILPSPPPAPHNIRAENRYYSYKKPLFLHVDDKVQN